MKHSTFTGLSWLFYGVLDLQLILLHPDYCLFVLRIHAVVNQRGCSSRKQTISTAMLHVLFTPDATGSELRALPCLWHRWTSLPCRTRRARWSALSSFVLSTSCAEIRRWRQKKGGGGKKQQWLWRQFVKINLSIQQTTEDSLFDCRTLAAPFSKVKKKKGILTNINKKLPFYTQVTAAAQFNKSINF